MSKKDKLIDKLLKSQRILHLMKWLRCYHILAMN